MSITLQIFSANTSRERAAEDGEVLGEDADRPAEDRAVAGHDRVAPGAVLAHPELDLAVAHEAVELDERARVEQLLDPLAREQLAALVLLRGRLLARRRARASALSSSSQRSFASVVSCVPGALVDRHRGEPIALAGQPPSTRRPAIESWRDRPARPLDDLALRRGRRAGRRSTYARDAQPIAVSVEGALGALDGGDALLFPAGMGAVTGVVLTLLPPGGTIALAEGAYYGTGSCSTSSRRWGVERRRVRPDRAAAGRSRPVWLEAPSNPILTMPDFEAAAAHPAPVVCDATPSTPLHLRPLERGCDVVAPHRDEVPRAATTTLLGGGRHRRRSDEPLRAAPPDAPR